MPPKRKRGTIKVAQVGVKQRKIEDVGDEPKAKRGRLTKEHKEVETSVVKEKRKKGKLSKEHKEVESPIVEEKMQKGYTGMVKKGETEKAKETADIEDIVSKQPKRRGRSATVSEDSKLSKEVMKAKKGRAKPVAENEQVLKGKQKEVVEEDYKTTDIEDIVLKQPKRRGRSATVSEDLKPPKGDLKAKKGRAKAVAENEQVLKGKQKEVDEEDYKRTDIEDIVSKQPKTRGRSATVSEASKPPKGAMKAKKGRAKAVAENEQVLKGKQKEVVEEDYKTADIADLVSKQPKRRGRSATVSEDSEPSKEVIKAKKGRAKPVAENEQVLKGKQKEVDEEDYKTTDIEDIVSKQPKRRGRSATVSEASKPPKGEMKAKKGRAKAVAENEQVLKGKQKEVVEEDYTKNDVDRHPKRRGKSATGGLKSKNWEGSSNPKLSIEEVYAAKEKVKTAKLIAAEKAKAAKLVAKDKAKAAKLVSKEKLSAKLASKMKTAKLAAKMKTRNKKSTQNRRGWLSDEVKVFEFIVTLKGTSPKIWRKFQVLSSFTFAELHNAINNCMGWLNFHMHEFRMLHPKTRKRERIGRSFDIFGINCPDIVNECETKIEDYFTEENKNAEYIYDWGDHWDHKITLHRILPIKSKATYPNCVSGKWACPPEDVGGIEGFYEFVEVFKNPEHPDYEDMTRWIVEGYDPNHFDPKKVDFENNDSIYIGGRLLLNNQ